MLSAGGRGEETMTRIGPLLLVLLSAPGLSVAQPVATAAPSQAQLDRAVRFGTIATTGPLCGLRDPRWGADLRSAELQAMDAPPAPAAEARRRADMAGAALSYAEDEALEDFADGPPAATCGPLAHNPDLARADAMVDAWRRGTRPPIW